MLRLVEIHVFFVLGLALTISRKHEFWLLVAGTVDLASLCSKGGGFLGFLLGS